MNIKAILAIIVMGVFYGFATGQNAKPVPVKATLTLAEARETYRTGDPIRLVVSFTAETDGYSIDEHVGKPMLSLDQLIVSPKKGIFPWLEISSGPTRGTDFSMIRELSLEPANIKFAANDFIRFDEPGTYTLLVRTTRAYKSNTDPRREAFTLETNTVKVTIVPMTPDEEAHEVDRLGRLIGITSDVFIRERYTEELGYLPGDIATREKVSRILDRSLNDGNYNRALFIGLGSIRNRELALSMFEAALQDPDRVPTHDLMFPPIDLRLVSERVIKWQANPELLSSLAASDQKRREELRAECIKKFLGTLPQRKGQSLIRAAIVLLEFMRPYGGTADPTIHGAIRPILLDHIDDIDVNERDRILLAFWKELKDPRLVPILEKTLRDYQGDMTSYRENALEHLMELNPARALPFFIEEIRNPGSSVKLEVLEKLKDEVLPEVDDALLKMLSIVPPERSSREYYRPEAQAARLPRFASSGIYVEIKSLFEENRTRYSPSVRGSILAYLAKYSEIEAENLIAEEINGSDENATREVLNGLTKSGLSAIVRNLLIERLEGEVGLTVADAAWRLSKHSTDATDRVRLIDRLDRWRKEWGSRITEVDSPKSTDTIKWQATIEREIVLGLINGKAWKATPEEIDRLSRNCLTKYCKDQFPKIFPPIAQGSRE